MKTTLVAIYHHPEMLTLHEAIGQQDHRTLVMWALETGKEILEIYKTTFPDDPRPAQALEAAIAWSRGEIKMPLAKKAARETHEAAKDAKMAKGKRDIEGSKIDAAVAAAHAMGQIIGVVHVATHSTAYAAYAVQAQVFLHSQRDPEVSLAEAVEHLSERLAYWASVDKTNRPWANFL
jgi:hypothetical protein